VDVTTMAKKFGYSTFYDFLTFSDQMGDRVQMKGDLLSHSPAAEKKWQCIRPTRTRCGGAGRRWRRLAVLRVGVKAKSNLRLLPTAWLFPLHPLGHNSLH